MISNDKLEQIQKRCTDAGLGYATITSIIYHKDVNELLRDREQLLGQIKELQVKQEESA